MKRAVKIIPIGIVLLVLLVAIASFWLDTMIKSAVEKIGPRVTRTAVHLDSVRLSLLSGRGQISGLVIGNPEGFKTESALKLADTRIHVDIGSVLSNRVLIDEIMIDGPEVTYEKGGSENNIDQIQKNVEAYSQDKPSPKNSKKKTGAQKTFQINRLVLKNGRVRLNTALTAGQTTEVPLPDIELKDIGKGPKGATAEEVSSKILSAIEAGVLRAIASVGKNAVQGLEKAGGNAGETAKEVGGQAGKATSGSMKNVRGLFGK